MNPLVTQIQDDISSDESNGKAFVAGEQTGVNSSLKHISLHENSPQPIMSTDQDKLVSTSLSIDSCIEKLCKPDIDNAADILNLCDEDFAVLSCAGEHKNEENNFALQEIESFCTNNQEHATEKYVRNL